jgi:bacterioferritin-associated ferredoxin
MYACICHNITDQKLEDTILKSKGDIKEVLKKLGMGKSCGNCLIESIEKLSNQKSSKKDSTQVG